MPDTVELEIPRPIEAAAKRMMLLLECGYLPPGRLKSDIEVLMHSAIAWDIYCQNNDAKKSQAS